MLDASEDNIRSLRLPMTIANAERLHGAIATALRNGSALGPRQTEMVALTNELSDNFLRLQIALQDIRRLNGRADGSLREQLGQVDTACSDMLRIVAAVLPKMEVLNLLAAKGLKPSID